MREFPRGVLFSDLDGTFLDERYVPAVEPAELHRLAESWRVIWVSSRTAAELLALQRTLSRREDAIGENGGVLLTFDHARATQFGAPTALEDAWVVTLAAPIAATRTRTHEALATAGASALEVSAITATAMAERSGYTITDATRALDRRTSVLLSELSASAPAALDALRSGGCSVVHGGRWTSVVDGSDKGRAARRWLALSAPGATTVGVGDADNDVTLLSVVDHPFVIRRAKTGPSATLMGVPRARALDAVDTAGWRELVALLPSLAPDVR